MKKFIIAMLLLCSGLCASAQTTWSLRTGAGLGTRPCSDHTHAAWAVVLNLNSNIALKRGSGWIFSPGLTANIVDDDYGFYVPLQFGYKAKIGRNSLFIPKVGFAGGYMSNIAAIVGPCGELGFEIKHFTVGFDFYYSPLGRSHYGRSLASYGAHLTFGYKF